MHQHDIDRHAMQPRGKRRLAAKRSDFSKELQESFLRQIFRLGRVRGHAQAERIHPPLMQVIEKLESFSITLLGAFNGLRFGKPAGFLVFSVGQVAFPGRILSDAAKYLYVVLVAGHFGMPAPAPFPIRITKPIARVAFGEALAPR